MRAFLDGDLPGAEHSELPGHLDHCDRCCRWLEELAGGPGAWAAVARSLRTPRADRTPELAQVMAVLRTRSLDAEETAAPLEPASHFDFLAPCDKPGCLGRLDRYEIVEVIGRGGMGVVLKAFDPTLGRPVAIKVLASPLAQSDRARERFRREVRAMAAVPSEHVVGIHAVEETARTPYLVMEYVSGNSLQERLDMGERLPVEEIIRIGREIAAGLAAAHARGLVHRDIKPANILLEQATGSVKITDFGLARAVDDASLTQVGTVAGTPEYMAPEQADAGPVD